MTSSDTARGTGGLCWVPSVKEAGLNIELNAHINHFTGVREVDLTNSATRVRFNSAVADLLEGLRARVTEGGG